MGIIKQIVNRCHVSDSHRQVIKYVISRLVERRATWESMTRQQRRRVMRDIIKVHDNNRELYNIVTRG